MGGALVYLTLCSLRNRVRVRLKRLREPRYLLGLVAGLFYFYAILLGPRRAAAPQRAPFNPMATFARYRGLFELAGGTLMLVGAAAAWLLPSGRPALAFSRADVQFLFPAPVTRRQLLHYKLIRSQLGTLLGSALLTFIFRPRSIATGWTFFVGMALTMATVNLYLMGVSLRRESLVSHGRAGLIHQGLPVAIVAAALLTVGVTVGLDWSVLSTLHEPRAILDELYRIGSSGAAGIALLPFTAVTRLPLSGSAAEFVRALPAALAIFAATYIWVLRSDVAFEEASAELAETVATRRPGSRAVAVKRAKPAPFSLAAAGRPELAILWKNLISVGRYASPRTFLRFLGPLIIGGFVMSRAAERGGLALALSFFCFFCAALTVLLGPQWARNDLRQDLAYLSVLKSWPVRGAAIVAGEVLAPTALLTGMFWLFMIGIAALADPATLKEQGLQMLSRASGIVAAMILAPAVILVQVLVQNAVAVMFPDWVSIGAAGARGVEVIGQRMLMMAGLMLTLLVALVPAALVAAAAGFAMYAVTHVVPLVIPALVAATVLVIECAVVVELLGRAFDRMDLRSVSVPD